MKIYYVIKIGKKRKERKGKKRNISMDNFNQTSIGLIALNDSIIKSPLRTQNKHSSILAKRKIKAKCGINRVTIFCNLTLLKL